MALISISDALYQRLRETAHRQGVSPEIILQEALENIGTPPSLSLQEEQILFDKLDLIEQRNGKVLSADWGKLISDMRD